MPSNMTPEEAKASLGIATHLQDTLLMPKKTQDTPQEPNSAPEAPSNQENASDTKAQMEGLETRLMDELSTLKEEIKKTQPQDANKVLEDLKKQIDSALNFKE